MKIRELDPFATVVVNVYDIKTKKIIFSGSKRGAAKFIGTSTQNIDGAIKRKSKIKKLYAVRFAV